MKTIIIITLFVLVELGAGCRHAPMDYSGTGSFRFVHLPASADPTNESLGTEAVASDKVYIDAIPLKDLVSPRYPDSARKGRAGWAMVGVRVTIDTHGVVSNVEPSLVALSTPGPFAHEFRRAVDEALAQWRFRPAEIRHVEQASAQGATWNRVIKIERVERTLEVAFEFSPELKVTSSRR